MMCPNCGGTGVVADVCGYDMTDGRWCPRELGHAGYHASNDDPSKWWMNMDEWNARVKSV